MNALTWEYVRALFALFVLGGCGIGVASLTSANPRKLWALFALEFAQVAAILVPAALGFPELVYLALALACGRELALCLAAGGTARQTSALIAGAIVGGGFAALGFLARASFAALTLGYLIVEINDVAAWAIGSAIGRHKLWPQLSPNKTWEGLVGGIAASVALAVALHFLMADWSAVALIGAGVLLALSGTAGDLIASAFKRRAHQRNYGALIPFQGGVFDLYDSLVFAAPAWLLYLFALGALK